MPLYVAHRGYSGKYPENTALAFSKAIEMEIDMIETDLRLSKDNVWLMHHDPSFKQISHEEQWVSETLAHERPEDVLTFQETLELINGQCQIYLDIKGHPTEKELETLLTTIANISQSEQSDWKLEHFYLASFNFKIVKILLDLRHRLNHQLKIGLIGELMSEHLLPETPDGLNLQGIEFVSTNIDHVTQNYIDLVRQSGLQVFVYTLNTKFALKHYHDLGVDALLTDHVHLFKDF